MFDIEARLYVLKKFGVLILAGAAGFLCLCNLSSLVHSDGFHLLLPLCNAIATAVLAFELFKHWKEM